MGYSYRSLGVNGRLGNQLFQIAGTLGVAHAERAKAHFPSWAYESYFLVPQDFFGDVPIDATDLGRDYLQDISLFANFETTVHEYLSFSEHAHRNAAETLPQFAESGGVHRTAIHIRRGDYLKTGNFFPTCPIHYFESCMDEVRQKFPDTQFLVFTDDPEWSHGHFDGLENIHIVSEQVANTVEREMSEFVVMTSCDSFIISNSTFSWWAAFLSQSDHVFVPSRWYNEELSHLDATKFLPLQWHQRSIAPLGPYKPHHVSVVESSTGLIVTNNHTRAVHHMNSTAALFFELCTGSNSQNRIVELMQAFFAEHQIQFSSQDAEATLLNLTSRGLISTDGIAELI
jgi:Glycosyl transferase family 11